VVDEHERIIVVAEAVAPPRERFRQPAASFPVIALATTRSRRPLAPRRSSDTAAVVTTVAA
jgi:hypothetical protein